MSDCREIRKAFADGDAGPGGSRPAWVEEHMAVCESCRKENEALRAVLSGADSMRLEIEEAMAGVDWEAFSERVVDQAVAASPARDGRARRSAPSFRLGLHWRPLLAGAAAGLVLGCLAMFFLLRRGPGPAGPLAAYSASGEFIDRVEYQMARRNTIDLLEKSEYVILDLIQPSAAQTGAGSSAAVERARELLSRKRYIDPRLGDVRMAKARDICNLIETLFLELAQLDGAVAAEETDRLRRFVEDRNLLLQIRMLKKELRESEM